MTDIDRLVAGVTCRDVLADLSDFIDGSLAAARVAQLQAHLAGCDTCSRFGGAVSDAVQALRSGLASGPVLPDGAGARLRERLAPLTKPR